MWLGELVLRSPPRQPSGGFPKNPAVLNKGQSSGRQRSKTCYFSSLSPNDGCGSEGAPCRLMVAAPLDCDREYRCMYGIDIRGKREKVITSIDLNSCSCMKEFKQQSVCVYLMSILLEMKHLGDFSYTVHHKNISIIKEPP